MANIQIDLTDNRDEIITTLRGAIPAALFAVGATAEGYAKEECPVDTGRLRNSISHAEDEASVYIGTNVEYAPFVELGAQGRNPVHFLRNAATDHSEEYAKLIEQIMRNA